MTDRAMGDEPHLGPVQRFVPFLKTAALVVTIFGAIPTAITEWFYWIATRRYFESPGGHIRVFQPRELALALARAGVRVDGVGFAHALHSPYWGVRALLGLDDETPGPTRALRRFLIHAAVSRVWTRVEHGLDWVFPKSLVLYGTRVAAGRRVAA